MRRTERAAFALVLLAALASFGCPKKHKPPFMTRVWLGAANGCSLLKEGTLACWGDDAGGQLADGTTNARPTPAKVAIEPPPTEVALGDRHGCGLFGDGEVRCWGQGKPAGPFAVAVAGAPLVASALVARGDRTCAIANASRELHCWASLADAPFVPATARGVRVSSVALSDHTVCAAVEQPREVRCFGFGATSPSTKAMLPNADVVGLTGGGDHFCALLADGSVQCWGRNASGQLGDGTSTDSSDPVLVHGIENVVSVTAGHRHTCVRLKTNTVACWGDNRFHQLSDGTTDARARPGMLPGLNSVLELASAGDASCARLADGGIRCWGKNDHGQLGDGTQRDHDVPMPTKW